MGSMASLFLIFRLLFMEVNCQVLNSPADWEQLKEVAAIVAAQPTTV